MPESRGESKLWWFQVVPQYRCQIDLRVGAGVVPLPHRSTFQDPSLQPRDLRRPRLPIQQQSPHTSCFGLNSPFGSCLCIIHSSPASSWHKMQPIANEFQHHATNKKKNCGCVPWPNLVNYLYSTMIKTTSWFFGLQG